MSYPAEYPEVSDISTEATRYESPNTQALLEYSRLDADLQEIYLILSGQVYDEANAKIVKSKYSRALLNSDGVLAIMMQLRPYFSRSATFNDIKPEYIMKMLKTTMKNVQRQLLSSINQKRWELHQSDIEAIWETLRTYTTINLNRSNKGGERTAITTSVQSKEITNQQAPKQKRRIFGINIT